MSLSGLLDLVAGEPKLAAALADAREGGASGVSDTSLVAPPALRPFAAAALARETGRTVLAVTATGREAEDLAAALSSLLGPEPGSGGGKDGEGDGGNTVAVFPAWETLPHERLSPRSDTVGQRLAVLRRLAHPVEGDAAAGPLRVVVAPVRAVLQPIVRGLGDLSPVRLRAGDDADLDAVVHRLVENGYHRVDMVEKRGEVAVRGGLLDVFPPTEEHPLRLEFWGDSIEEIRWFKVADQRSLEVAEDGLFAAPCRELLLTGDVRDRAAALSAEHPALAEILDQLAEGMPVEGMEAFAPVLAGEMDLLIDHLPARAAVFVCDPERIRSRADELVRTSQEFLEASWINAAAGGEAPIDLEAAAFRTLEEIRDRARELGQPWWSIAPFGGEGPGGDGPGGDGPSGALVLDARESEAYRGDTQRALGDIKGWLADEKVVVLLSEGHGPAERMVELLKGVDLPARLEAGLDRAPDPKVVHVTTGLVDHGFVSPSLAVLTHLDLVGQKASTKDMRRLPSRRRNMVDPLQLKVGDHVVHEQHGVGRYIEMVQRTVQGATREYLVIEYAKGDRLYVPTDQLDEVTRYVGGESPTLNRMGGADWAKAKTKAKKAVKEIAGELIRLYSARMASPGHAFGPDTPWQREMEDAFPYAETGDQLEAIDEVKRDMERAIPMDRLICGDVGYGKTEIAVRAAFKAVQDGKQVAVLVPTTLLVQQHLSTFAERFSGFPLNVRPMSRFQTDAEVKVTMEGTRDGTVDVVIGTHRLLSPEVRFKNLGLIIIDEEQRFGVEHKEAMKHLRTQVDVLAMSATPIPRTLEMGLTGIREMSTILTPPEERHPILTFVGPYDEKQIAAALRRELMRDGQIFFVHNRVASINKVAARLRELVPEARVAVAHGQMNEQQLEKIMVGFWEREFDVLVSTTIVESGLDVPNANTLIVDRADNYGLSQLHQLRGRVGRGRERGYAYFLYPPEKPLTETAHERLATISQHTEMGAGMYVAMKDLEIRGAGNILGAEQSGFIAGVGFDLYVRMMAEAVQEQKAKLSGAPEQEERPDVKVELPINAHIPHDYVTSERLRLEAYKRVAAICTEDDIAAVRAELADRYGRPPQEVENLLAVAHFRIRARKAGLTDVTLQGQHIRFSPVALRDSQQVRLQRLYPKALLKQAADILLVPVPKTKPLGGQPLRDLDLLRWCDDLVEAMFLEGSTATGR
ncbi:transcription-repair coupling factor [Planomonospora venezuelensis]|uniref:Transcription-repair-coupling factor n=1 Tax=Planomonospora venezuelensis TaxID=1999 RepID=A0A841D163_PLAVE|nr:transcription-repair coupling factor [Planomonospora venezuelensis]MBB5962733.1 transcription-repair coupling factor (superfamily II helicase) [Planomonospora venezuelensis]GIM99471.1 transcription-repair-coupling factor [Planomonospora venezuelensis]